MTPPWSLQAPRSEFFGLLPAVLRALCLDESEDVGLAQHEQVLPVDLDLGPAVLAVEALVALLHVQRDALAVIVEPTIAGGDDLALLRLLLGSVGEHETARGRQLLLDCPHDQTIAQGLQLHLSYLHLESASGVRRVLGPLAVGRNASGTLSRECQRSVSI